MATTLEAAGLGTAPYHAYVPSFGEWGFILAAHGAGARDRDALPAGSLPHARDEPRLFDFPPDMARRPAPVNRLDNQVLVREFAEAWCRIMKLDRRALIGAAAALAGGLGLTGLLSRRKEPGGHDGRRRSRARAPAARRRLSGALGVRRGPIVVAGGGVAGLAAGGRSPRHGYGDFVLLELEDRPGGNARAGRNAVSAFPLGAHYLPCPEPRGAGARGICSATIGMIVGDARRRAH